MLIYQGEEKGSDVKVASVENSEYVGYEFPHHSCRVREHKEPADPKEEECSVLSFTHKATSHIDGVNEVE